MKSQVKSQTKAPNRLLLPLRKCRTDASEKPAGCDIMATSQSSELAALRMADQDVVAVRQMAAAKREVK
jgi:hypothetical protein